MTAPQGMPAASRWLVAGTPVSEPYPCRCSERRFAKCSATFCPCSGRPDPQGETCCGWTNTPERAAAASAEYRLRRERERAGEGS